MDLCYLLDLIDEIIEFQDLLSICLDEWNVEKVIKELVHFRRKGRLSGEYMSHDARAVFNLMFLELKSQIKEADPEWFEGYVIKQEEREHEARVVDAFLEEQARIDEFNEGQDVEASPSGDDGPEADGPAPAPVGCGQR